MLVANIALILGYLIIRYQTDINLMVLLLSWWRGLNLQRLGSNGEDSEKLYRMFLGLMSKVYI